MALTRCYLAQLCNAAFRNKVQTIKQFAARGRAQRNELNSHLLCFKVLLTDGEELCLHRFTERIGSAKMKALPYLVFIKA